MLFAETVVCQIEGGDETEGNRDNSNPMQSMLGTARAARERVRLYFAEIRDHLTLKECAALAVVESHIRERLGCIRQHQENLTAMLSQVCKSAFNLCQQSQFSIESQNFHLIRFVR